MEIYLFFDLEYNCLYHLKNMNDNTHRVKYLLIQYIVQ